MKSVIQRPATALLLVLLSAPVAAADLTFNAYIGIPFGGGSPFAGVSAHREIGSFAHDSHGSAHTSQVKLDLRFRPTGGTVLSLNDIALTHPPIRYASDNGTTESAQSNIDWQTIVGATLGVALIVAIVDSDDTKIVACSGPNCPPEKEPPAEPASSDSAGDT